MGLFNRNKKKPEGSSLMVTDDKLNFMGGRRKPLFPIEERIERARFIERNDIEYSEPDKPDGGSLNYIDERGDRVYARLKDDEEHVEVFGFNITEKLDEDELHSHEAYKTKDGLLVLKSGACWQITKQDGTVVIPDAHTIFWIGDKIYSTLGGSFRSFDATRVSGEIINTEKGYVLVGEQGSETCSICEKRKISGRGYERSVCAHCQREKDDLDWKRKTSK